LHSLMFAETGVPVLLGLFCKVNARVLATAVGAVAAHSATAYWDQAYAEPRRWVTPAERQSMREGANEGELRHDALAAVRGWAQRR